MAQPLPESLQAVIDQVVSKLPDNPKAKAFAHDMPIIWAAYDEVAGVSEGNFFWHNGAFDALLDNQLHFPLLVFLQSITKFGPGMTAEQLSTELLAIMKTIAETFFQMGIKIGEGPEHIDKCTSCKQNVNDLMAGLDL